VAAIAAVAVCAAILLLVWRPWDTAPAIATMAPGVWQEQTAAQPVRMTVSRADGGDDGAQDYWIDLPASSEAPARGRLDGDAIVVRADGSPEVVWRITYDAGADVLLLARPDGSERHILRRISRR
jgi:hypothetical protein